MLRIPFRMAVNASLIAVVVGLGWTAYGAVGESEAAHVNESFSLVNHQTDAVGEALEGAGTFIDSEIGGSTGQIRDIDELLDAWTPKYQMAETGIRKFDASLAVAEESADAYFVAQRALTARIHGTELGALARAEDDAESSQYEEWRGRAHSIQSNAAQILQRLHDMDATLQKLKLRSDFSFDVGQLSEVPSDIVALEQELAQFRVASDNIRIAIGSPFDAES